MKQSYHDRQKIGGDRWQRAAMAYPNAEGVTKSLTVQATDYRLIRNTSLNDEVRKIEKQARRISRARRILICLPEVAASGWGGGFGTGQKVLVGCWLIVWRWRVSIQHSTVQCDPSLLTPAGEKPGQSSGQSSGHSAEGQVGMGAPGTGHGAAWTARQGQDFQWIPTNLWLAHLPH